MSKPQWLPAAGRTSQPWKNGGGSTSEVLAYPPGAGWDDFGWRVSIATIEQSGAFSRFPGIQRSFYLLRGALELSIDGVSHQVDAAHPLQQFSGEAEVHALLQQAEPALALNLMSRVSGYRSQLRRLDLHGSQELHLHSQHAVLLLQQGECAVGELRMHSLDALHLQGGHTLALQAEHAQLLLMEIDPIQT
jgi:environmental stress-induced protein Ves